MVKIRPVHVLMLLGFMVVQVGVSRDGRDIGMFMIMVIVIVTVPVLMENRIVPVHVTVSLTEQKQE